MRSGEHRTGSEGIADNDGRFCGWKIPKSQQVGGKCIVELGFEFRSESA